MKLTESIGDSMYQGVFVLRISSWVSRPDKQKNNDITIF